MPKLSIELTGLSPSIVDAIEAAPMMRLDDVDVSDSLEGDVTPLVRLLGDETTRNALARDATLGVQAGLWLLAGDLDRSHAICQDDPTAEGSFWHGIMHRREGDFSNAGYWFRRVGRHEVLDELASAHPAVYADGHAFIDNVRQSIRGDGDGDACVAAQWDEWQRLMRHGLG